MTAEPPAPGQPWVLSPDTALVMSGWASPEQGQPSFLEMGWGRKLPGPAVRWVLLWHPDWLPDQPHSFPSHRCSAVSQEMPGQR